MKYDKSMRLHKPVYLLAKIRKQLVLSCFLYVCQRIVKKNVQKSVFI